MPPNRRFVFVDALRGPAALGVVLFHAEEGQHISELFGHMPRWLQISLEHGDLGVAVFFVLSGFVIAHSLYEQRLSLDLLGRFTLRRSIRLDPPYWIAIAITIGLSTLASAAVKGRPPHDYSLGQVVAHLFYLQDILGYKNIGVVFWTLCFEIQFYLVYAILLFIGRNDPEARFNGRRTAIVLLIAGSVSLLWPLHLGPELRDLFPRLWYGFLLGVGAYWSWRDRGVAPMFAAYALIIGASAIAYSDNFSLACVITSVSLFLVGAADRLRTAWNWRWLQFLGAISYSLYLTHTPITNAVFRVGYMMTGRNLYLEVIWWAASIAACIAFASVMWWAIERPCVRLAQKVSFPKQNEKQGDLYPQPSIAE